MFVIQGHLQEVCVCKQTFWLFQDDRSGSKKTKHIWAEKKKYLGRNMLQNALFEAFDFQIFWGTCPQTPLEAAYPSCGVFFF